MNKILVTGGLGYIGSHICVSLIENGYQPIAVDNLSNSELSTVNNINKITKKKLDYKILDLRDKYRLNKFIDKNNISSIIHLAAFKSVEYSLKKPFEYFDNNISSLINLLNCFEKNKLKQIIFSSSACVYGNSKTLPIKENSIIQYENPYGHTKIIGEKIIENFCQENKCNYSNLRYFNPSGCHETGLIGENFSNKDKSLMSNILKSLKTKKKLNIYGHNYKTKDGTAARDFVHVADIANGHINALKYLKNKKKNITCNLGSGKGTTVLELITNFQSITGEKINFKIVGEREGDSGNSFACIKKSMKELKWKPKMTLSDISNSSYKWFLNKQRTL